MNKTNSKEESRAYMLVLIQRKYGPLNQVLIEELTWLDLENLQQLTTTLDPTYRNYKNWHSILTARQPQGIYKNLKRTDRLDKYDNQIISADSKPKCILAITQEVLAEVLEELATPQFVKLFE